MKTALLLAAGGHKTVLVDVDSTIFIQFGIFLLLLVILTRFVFRPYLALLKERDQNIGGAREEAQRTSADADGRITSYEEQILKARKEAATVRVAVREEGEKAAAEVLSQARAASDQKVAAAREKIHKSAEAAQLALRARADRIAQDIATRLLGREV